MTKIQLSKNGRKNRGLYHAIVDNEDSDLKWFNWTCAAKKKGSRTVYAHRVLDGKRVYMHQVVAERFLGSRPKGMFIDHLDRDGLNNRRSNLRYVSISVNNKNKDYQKGRNTIYPGVSRKKSRFKAVVYLDNKEFFVGYFECPAVAVAKKILAELGLIRGR